MPPGAFCGVSEGILGHDVPFFLSQHLDNRGSELPNNGIIRKLTQTTSDRESSG